MHDWEDFHARLKEADPDWFKEGVSAYYKCTEPITSNPESGIDQWTSVLTFEGKKISPDAQGIYRADNDQVSFEINDFVANDQKQGIAISMVRNGISTRIECNKSNEEKMPALTKFNNYNDLVSALRGKKLWWREKVTYQSYSSPNDPESSAIEIVRVNAKKNPITLRGIEFTYRQDSAKTKIYFDFVDSSQRPIPYFRPIISNHKQSDVNKKVYRVCKQILYEFNAKDITSDIFDSLKTRNEWISNAADFYDQNQHKGTTLPHCYCNCNDYQGVPVEPITYILEENLNGFYEFDGDRTLADENDYLYSSGDGQLFATLPYKASFKEYLSEHDKINVHYLEQVTVPALSVDKNVAIEGGHHNWPAGVYKRTSSFDNTTWQPIGMQAEQIVQFYDEVLHQPATRAGKLSHTHEACSAQQGKRWCDAAQRMFVVFGAKIGSCDKSLLQGFAAWNKLTSLDISNLKLEEDVAWDDVATAIGSLGQLTALRFCNNSPIVDFNEDYDDLADRASRFYGTLGASLGLLKNLRELHIQGLWLKSHKVLEDYVADRQERLREPAILTGIINHRNRTGVSSIINGIRSLQHLKILSMDDIPNQGFSFAAREKSISLATMVSCFLIPIDFLYQSRDLKAFTAQSAVNIATMPSLEKICIYTPKEDCEKSLLNTPFTEHIQAYRNHSLAIKLSVLNDI